MHEYSPRCQPVGYGFSLCRLIRSTNTVLTSQIPRRFEPAGVRLGCSHDRVLPRTKSVTNRCATPMKLTWNRKQRKKSARLYERHDYRFRSIVDERSNPRSARNYATCSTNNNFGHSCISTRAIGSAACKNYCFESSDYNQSPEQIRESAAQILKICVL